MAIKKLVSRGFYLILLLLICTMFIFGCNLFKKADATPTTGEVYIGKVVGMYLPSALSQDDENYIKELDKKIAEYISGYLVKIYGVSSLADYPNTTDTTYKLENNILSKTTVNVRGVDKTGLVKDSKKITYKYDEKMVIGFNSLSQFNVKTITEIQDLIAEELYKITSHDKIGYYKTEIQELYSFILDSIIGKTLVDSDDAIVIENSSGVKYSRDNPYKKDVYYNNDSRNISVSYTWTDGSGLTSLVDKGTYYEGGYYDDSKTQPNIDDVENVNSNTKEVAISTSYTYIDTDFNGKLDKDTTLELNLKVDERARFRNYSGVVASIIDNLCKKLETSEFLGLTNSRDLVLDGLLISPIVKADEYVVVINADKTGYTLLNNGIDIGTTLPKKQWLTISYEFNGNLQDTTLNFFINSINLTVTENNKDDLIDFNITYSGITTIINFSDVDYNSTVITNGTQKLIKLDLTENNQNMPEFKRSPKLRSGFTVSAIDLIGNVGMTIGDDNKIIYYASGITNLDILNINFKTTGQEFAIGDIINIDFDVEQPQ